METAEAGNRTHFFTVSNVKVQVKNFDIKLKKSNHKLLFLIGKPFLVRAIRPALQLVLEHAIKEKARELDALAYDIHREAKQATRDAAANPDADGDVKSMYQQYWNAAHARWLQQRKRSKAAQQADEAAGKGKRFNMAMTQQDSIFPDISLPSGISTKATEYKQLARTGDRWESPVFSIGGARETAKIPEAPEVRRKKHAFQHGKPAGTMDTTGAPMGAPGAMGVVPPAAVQQGAVGGMNAPVGITNGVHNNGVGMHSTGYEKHAERFEPLNA
jgi:hypothetical protein